MRPRLLSHPASLFDLTGRAALVLTGRDRVALLQGLLTNDLRPLAPGSGCHAALLTPKGKMVADLVVLVGEDRVLLDAEPPLAAPLARLIPGYVFFQDVRVGDETDATAVLHVEGSDAHAALARCGLAAAPDAPHAHAEGVVGDVPVRLVVESRGGAPGFDLRCSRAEAGRVAAALRAAGIPDAPPELLEASRIEAGIPRWGAELSESVLPNEALLERDAISYTKGCYVGQETVARIRTYGHVNRLLVRLELPPGTAAKPGDAVHAAGAPAGILTSLATDAGSALAFLARALAQDGSVVQVGGEAATVRPLG